ncbi:MAG TPA: MASE1 domain-containing protein [Burkholderiales bacterium]|jgi:signal transduction histidine kinase|nr:MASE1 domain-containing protein [Burkholderiales bacterium]
MDSHSASSAGASPGLTHAGWQFSPRATWAAPALLVAVGYYLAARIGFAFTLQPYPISTLWPPNALLLAALLLAPTRAWWWLLAAALPAHLLVELQSGVPVVMVLGWYISNCSEALIGAGLVRAFVPWPLRLDSLRNAGIFLFGGALAGPLVSSFLDAALVSLIGWGERGYWDLVGTRIFSNTLAALTVAPLILTLASIEIPRLRAARTVRFAEAAALFAGLAATCLVVFDLPQFSNHTAPALFYAPLPFLVWAALRFGPAGTASAIAVMVVATIFGTVNGLGPFAGSTPQETAREMQLFLSAVAVPMLLLAVVLHDRARVELDAREQRLQLTHLSRVAMLGELSGGIAHELNQPLTAILSNAQAAQHLIANKSADPEILVEILRDIIAADQRAGEVIRRLRTLFKRGETQFQPLDVNELVHEVLGIVHGDLVTRSVEIVPELAATLTRIHGDRVELEQVMLNLVINACDAMAGIAPEQRRLTVRTRKVDVEDGAVQISFSDCGPGFTPDQYAKLFEPFYTTKPRGLGLGLSISRAIIRAHHGRLWGSSTPGKGASFHMVLPAPRGR